MNKSKKNIYIVLFIIFLIIWYLQNRFFSLALYYNSDNFMLGLGQAIENVEYMFFELTPTTNLVINVVSLIIPIVILVLIQTAFNPKNYSKKNIEHGSAKWGNKEDIKNYQNKVKKKI